MMPEAASCGDTNARTIEDVQAEYLSEFGLLVTGY
jgi:hypothetical protein